VGLSLDDLRGEVPFRAWEDRREFTPEPLLLAVRSGAGRLLADLAGLGPEPPKTEVCAALKAFVLQANAANAAKDPSPVETGEREELFAFLEEVCRAVRQRAPVFEVDNWRAWQTRSEPAIGPGSACLRCNAGFVILDASIKDTATLALPALPSTRDAAASENQSPHDIQDRPMTEAAKAGDTVRIHYTGRLDDGTVFDKSEGREPLEFTAGSGEIIPGLDRGVLGMEIGESREVTVEPEEAYGDRDEARVQSVPRDAIPEHIPTDPGTQLSVQTQEGQTVPVVVSNATESHVELDANHPLAGRTLTFDVTLVEID